MCGHAADTWNKSKQPYLDKHERRPFSDLFVDWTNCDTRLDEHGGESLIAKNL